MIGAILGDIVGSVYEFSNIKTKDFPLFSQSSSYTDDSIMTIAVADCRVIQKYKTADQQNGCRKNGFCIPAQH